jgi:hypothetical protein
MMKRLFLTFACLLFAQSAFAQAQPGMLFKWNQPTAEVASVARFELKIDAGTYINAGKTLANDATTPTGMQSFSFVIPALTTGNHSFVVRACPASGACTADSASHAFTIFLISTPTGLRTGDAAP